eukprot:365865-Chlamydomonas_euryale.AAC.15
MPALPSGRRQRVHALAQGGYIMITWANHHYLDFAKSWVHHVKKAGVTGYMVGAMDDEMLRKLYDADIQTWRMDTGISKEDLGWGSPNFHKMVGTQHCPGLGISWIPCLARTFLVGGSRAYVLRVVSSLEQATCAPGPP